MSWALFAMVAVLATQPQAAEKAAMPKLTPMTFKVEASAKAGTAVEDWAKELRTALEARKDEFRLATAKEKPQFVVRLDSVGPASGGTQVLAGALVLDQVNRPFTYSFSNVRADAEKLARNLRSVADQMKSTGK